MYGKKLQFVKTCTFKIISGMAAVDTVVILTCIVLAGIPALFGASYGSKAFPILWPIQQIAWTASIYFTILLTLERYMAVFYKKLASLKKTIASMTCVFIFSVLYNITRFLEYNTIYIPALKTTDAQENETYGLLSNDSYIVGYLICCNLIFRLILPMCILVFCNVRIIRKVNIYYQKRHMYTLCYTTTISGTCNSCSDV